MGVRTARSGTVEIAYETFGAADGRPLLLVMGLDSPMQWWPDGFCAALAERGFQVARFDDRDCGRSTRYREQHEQSGQSEQSEQHEQHEQHERHDRHGQHEQRARHQQREKRTRRIMPGLDLARQIYRPPAYTANDMVGDGIAVMDALGWRSAHIVGASLGAGLALGTAIRHPARVRTVVSMMGLPSGFHPADAVRYVNVPGFLRFARLGTRTPATVWEDLHAQVETARMLASRGHPFDEQWAYATASACRVGAPGDPATARRQLAAMRADGGLLRRASEIAAPLLVLHGADDPLIKPAAATALARRVHGAKCVIYADMGHEVPRHLWGTIADEIGRHAELGELRRDSVVGLVGEPFARQTGTGAGAAAAAATAPAAETTTTTPNPPNNPPPHYPQTQTNPSGRVPDWARPD